MVVAYIGNFQPRWSTENDVRRAFEHLGWRVLVLQENEVTWQQVREHAFRSKLLLWTGTWDTAQPLPETLDTLRQCAMKGIPTATLHLDTFWPVSRGGRKWWLAPMMFTRYVFSADGDWPEKWQQLGIDHRWSPPAVRHDAAHFGKPRPQYQCEVAFVGSNGVGYHEAEWPYRRQLLKELEAMCQRNGWSFKNPGGRDPKIDRGEDMNDFYRSAAVTVGDSLCLKREDSKYFSDRQFEVWGRGGMLIMPRINVLDELMEGNQPFYEWGDWAGLENMIRHYLQEDIERRTVVQKNQALVAYEHTYVNRVQTLLKEVGLG